MRAPLSRYPGRAFLAMVLLSAAAGCDDLSVNAVLVVNLSVSPDSAAVGLRLTITLSNEGETEIEPVGEQFSFAVEDGMRRVVRRLEAPSGTLRLAPGASLSVDWDQKDENGLQVPAGSYVARASYSADGDIRQSTRSFTIE